MGMLYIRIQAKCSFVGSGATGVKLPFAEGS
jgi:hypothetical protein